MTIKLPKDLKGFAYDRVLPIDPNSFDVDLLLPVLFFRVISDGQDFGSNRNDPTDIRGYVQKLSRHPDLGGFGTDRDLRLLERLTRATLIQVGRRGANRSSSVEQILSIASYSLLAFKPGFPLNRSIVRRVDLLLYRMLVEEFRKSDAVNGFFQEVFGRGVVIKNGIQPDGWRISGSPMPTLTRLSIDFLDGFVPEHIKTRKDRPVREAFPALASAFARDLWRYLSAYHRLLPIEALTYHLKALVNFELFVYTVKLFQAVPDLVDALGELPPAMRSLAVPSPPELYLDFTGEAAGPSRTMAAGCVRRDLAGVQRFVHANLTLRQLDRYVQRLRGDRRVGQIVSEALGDDQGGPDSLQALLRLLDEPLVQVRIDAAAQLDEDRIREANGTRDIEDGDDDTRENEEIDRIAESGESDFERLVLLLYEGQGAKIGKSVISWYWSVGGLTKPHGILTGHQKSRQSWRYAPSNDLLATLVQLAAVDIPKWDKDNLRPQAIGLREFLGWLEDRFGILVDRPPAEFAGAEYVAAAHENLRAMLRRLRQMGVFRDLSDDFTVQRLLPPYASVDEVPLAETGVTA